MHPVRVIQSVAIFCHVGDLFGENVGICCEPKQNVRPSVASKLAIGEEVATFNRL